MNIKIIDERCFRCNGNKEMTNSHAIPLHMKPFKNIEYPLCKKCHDELHLHEARTVQKFIYKIYKILQDGIGKLNFLKYTADKHGEDVFTIGDAVKKK